MLWDLQIAPKSVETVRLKFFVKHPRDTPPQGLERIPTA